MKKIAAVLLAITLLLCTGCAALPAEAPAGAETPAPTAEPTPVPTPEPTPSPTPEPTYPRGTVIADSFGAVYAVLDRGEPVLITGEEGDYYRIDLDGVSCCVEKRLVRPGSEVYEPRPAYASGKLPIFANAYFTGEPLAELSFNGPVTVLEEYGGWMLVESDGIRGYIAADKISDQPIRVSSHSGGESGGGGGGADGGDIQLGYFRTERGRLVFLASGETGTVLADGTEVYIALLRCGDTVNVVERGEELCTLYFGGLTGTVPSWIIYMDGDAAYETWDGFAKSGAVLFPDHTMLKEGRELGVNTPVSVLYDLGDRFLTAVDGELGFISADLVSETAVKIHQSSGGSGGGEWTDPVL